MLVVRTLLTYLELLGFLEGGTPFYSSYQFKPQATSAEILGNFEGERRQFLDRLFRQARKGRTWFHIDVDEAAAAVGSPRDRVVRALDYLGEQGLMEVRSAGVRHRYRRLREPEDRSALVAKLYERTQERESREIARLGQVVELAAHQGCQVAALCSHFGETLAQRCGHCSWCLADGQPISLPPRPQPPMDEAAWRRAVALRREHPDVLGQPRALARLLCGVSSPKLARAKLSSHALFGALADVPFQTVLARAETAK
jgi:ATP-dependent DNA helicase RecQ